LAGNIRLSAGKRITISTTISQEYHDLAKKLGIGWNEALARGVRTLANKSVNLEEGVSYDKDEQIEKLQKAVKKLQEHILKMSEE
jgi:ethanolamine utilization microcompartment shell protein EutS